MGRLVGDSWGQAPDFLGRLVGTGTRFSKPVFRRVRPVRKFPYIGPRTIAIVYPVRDRLPKATIIPKTFEIISNGVYYVINGLSNGVGRHYFLDLW